MDQLDRSQRKKSELYFKQPLYWPPLFWVVFVAALTTEWILRKRYPITMTRITGYRFLEPQALARVKNLAMVARGVVEGAISGLHASPYKGFSVEFAEHREYTAGDDPRHLDYKMLARTERLYIKQYEEETNMRVQILLDISGSMGYKHDGKVTQAGIRLAT